MKIVVLMIVWYGAGGPSSHFDQTLYPSMEACEAGKQAILNRASLDGRSWNAPKADDITCEAL